MAQRNFYYCLLSLIMLSSFVKTDDCKIHDLFITLGDFFTPRKDINNYFTITVTMNSNTPCNPVVNLLNQGTDLQYYTATQIKPYDNVEFYTKALDYKRINYRFKISKTQGGLLQLWNLSDDQHTSTVYQFPQLGRVNPKNTAVTVWIADMDLSQCSIPMVQRMPKLDRSKIDFFAHVGDFAYDVFDQKGEIGDHFFDMMSRQFAAEIPYIVVAGNHEVIQVKMFDYRFKMPNSGKYYQYGNHYYSFDYKGVHYVTINWDYVFLINPSQKNVVMDWLKKDLEAAQNNPEINFKVFYTHRPTYCPCFPGSHCDIFYHVRSFEALFKKYGVDLFIHGHTHQYYRLKKQADFANHTGQQAELDPLIVVNGAAGCDDEPKTENKTNLSFALGMVDFMYTGSSPDFQSAYLELTTTPTQISGRLLRSLDNLVLDTFTLDKADRSLKTESSINSESSPQEEKISVVQVF